MARFIVLTLLLTTAYARFNQEQIPIPAISALTEGAPGVAQTIAGAAVSDLLAATNACDKLSRGDQILAELGTDPAVVQAAIGMVAAEKNFNPFAQAIPTICNDSSLPQNKLLRGITPLIDPAVVGSDVANALSKRTRTQPLDATGKSVADLLIENGFANFTGQSSAGDTVDVSSSVTQASTVAGATSATSSLSAAAVTDAASNDNSVCSAAIVTVTVTADAAADQATGTSSAVVDSTSIASGANAEETSCPAIGTAANSTGATDIPAGVDYGLCTPTMKFEGGLDNRPASEFTFQATDALIAKGQEEALNPNIITNAICNQLTNVCQANAASKALCAKAKAQILALGTRDRSTAEAWNSALGFPNAVTNPDGGLADPPVSSTSTAQITRRTSVSRSRRALRARV